MAARLWRWVLTSEIVIAAAVAAVVTVPYAVRVAAALAVLSGVQWLSTACSFAWAYVVAPREEFTSSPGRVLRALCSESVRFSLTTWGMSGEPCLHPPDIAAPRAGRPAQPVLLLHGILCNRAVWRPLLRRLRAAGLGPVHAISLEPLLVDIESHTAKVEREVLTLQRDSKGARVAIVAHSMGGLIARAALRSLGPGTISQIVTVASPHHGTAIARLFRSPCALQMRPGSSWLQRLNAAQEGRLPVPVTSIYSLEDNLLVPRRSAALQGATLKELRGLGHVGLLSARGSLDCVVAALTREATT